MSKPTMTLGEASFAAVACFLGFGLIIYLAGALASLSWSPLKWELWVRVLASGAWAYSLVCIIRRFFQVVDPS